MTIKKYIFFRDDDVFRLDKKFTNFFRLFQKYHIPVVYGIIPGKTEPALLNFLRRMKDRDPALFDLAQHGYKHINHNKVISGQSKYEFGSLRTYRDQNKDILTGWVKMRRDFQGKCAPIFIPPFHGYDFTTLKIMNELGEGRIFRVFSAGQKTLPKRKNFLDLPAEISYKAGQDPVAYPAAVAKDLIEKLSHRSVVGILCHHENYTAGDLKSLEKFLKMVKSRDAIQPILLSTLAGPLKRARLDVTLALTNACNLKCRACNIWMEKPRKIISFKVIRKFITALLRHYDIASVSLTGGEPFMHPEIDAVYDYFHHLKLDGKIGSLGVYSNGYDKSAIERFLRNNRDKLDDLDLGFSVDGLRKAHDFLRGKTGSFGRVAALIDGIINNFPTVRLGVKFTLSPLNADQLWPMYAYCRQRSVVFFPKFVESDSVFYYHRMKAPIRHNVIFSDRERALCARTLERILIDQKKCRAKVVDPAVIKALLEYNEEKSFFARSCTTPLYALFVTPSGDIHSCLYRGPLTRLGSPGWIEKLQGRAFLDIAQKGITGECPGCLAYHGYLKKGNHFGDGYA